MEIIDVNQEIFSEVEIAGYQALFTELRVDKSTVPEGVYCYELRHGDDDSFPANLEENVRVNYFGAVLISEKAQMNQYGCVDLTYEDFGYTGEEMRLKEFLKKQPDMEKEPDCEELADGKTLAEFLKETFSITEQEGDTLLGYLDGHAYILGQQGGQLYRGDLHCDQERTHWEEYSIEDIILEVCEWSWDLMEITKNQMENTDDFLEFTEKKNYYESLCETDQILDALYGRTKYGKEISELAEKLAEDFFQDMNREGGIDGAIQKMAEQLKAGEDLLPDVSPALKKDSGRAR